MRIVTRPDFDGIVCAVLLAEAENIRSPIKWVEPYEIQHNKTEILDGDIIANLPFAEGCAMWFDHHCTNKASKPFKGVLKEAPSAACLIFEYYKDNLQNDYTELVKYADKIDSADLTQDEVINVANYPYILLASTLSNFGKTDESYCNRLVQLLGSHKIDEVINDSEVKEQCGNVIIDDKNYKEHLLNNTKINQNLSITDFSDFDVAPNGNRFMVFSLFPETTVNIKIRNDRKDKERLVISIGHSIFNRTCIVNVGKLLAQFGGGGHHGAGSCSVSSNSAQDTIATIIDTLVENKPNET